MTRRGPYVDTEKQNYEILRHLFLDKGIGFNELWRALKQDEIGMSYSTLSRILKRLLNEEYVEVDKETHGQKIPKHLYYKTKSGVECEQHIADKIRLFTFPSKKIVKAHKSEIKFNQEILGEIPYTCEIELSSSELTKEKEEDISKLIETFSDVLISNIAESLNKAYSGFISLLGEGSIEDSIIHLKKALSFNLRLTMIFDGHRVALNENWFKNVQRELEDLNVPNTIKNPSDMELLSCWIFGLISQIFHSEDFKYDLSDLNGWSRFITNFSNQWRKEKGIPPLEEQKVMDFLEEQVRKGSMSIKPFHVSSGILQFHEKLPELHMDESYSFLLGLISSLKSMAESVN